MKKILTTLLFLGFILLCGAEIGPKFIASAKKEGNTALYVSSAKNPPPEKKEEADKTDYQALVKGIDPNGA